jgi:cellobiose-specific phosphotransferase system component IIC
MVEGRACYQGWDPLVNVLWVVFFSLSWVFFLILLWVVGMNGMSIIRRLFAELTHTHTHTHALSLSGLVGY